MKTHAVISMLHESADSNSANLKFRDAPVLASVLRRLTSAQRVEGVTVLCWDDQAGAAQAAGATTRTLGPRRATPVIEAVAAARRWAGGWRGGLLNSTEFDLGFDGPAVRALLDEQSTDAVILIAPSAGVIDPTIVDLVIERAQSSESTEFAFAPAAPGFGAMLLKRALIERLAGAGLLPGRLLTYQPDAPMRDPLGSDGCVEIPTSVTRSQGRFKLDSICEIERLGHAWAGLNGELESASAERLVALAGQYSVEPLPRDVVLELTTRRATRPTFSPLNRHAIARDEMTPELAQRLFSELSVRDDVRVTFGGVGDPLLLRHLPRILSAARDSGIRAIQVQTDLLPEEPAMLDVLADSAIDVVSVHIPAMSPAVYAQVMGADRMSAVVENIRRLLTLRAAAVRGTPVIAPTFVKSRLNLHEMEAWYDQWLRAIGSAVITGPSDFGGLIDDVSAGELAPPRRIPCRRLASRMTVLSNGTVVSCEQDVLGARPLGRVGEQSIESIWREGVGALRTQHADRRWDSCAVCDKCREWHRP